MAVCGIDFESELRFEGNLYCAKTAFTVKKPCFEGIRLIRSDTFPRMI